MLLTLAMLLNNAKILAAVIDRSVVSMLEMDKVFWKDYLVYDRANPDGTFKTYLGTQIGVIAGTVIDRYANRPIRKRHALTHGHGEVACLGDAYQMDNTRIERLEVLIAEYNEQRTDEARAIKLNEIIDFLVDDVRQCMLAPMKRFDLMMGSLRFKGTCKVDGKENKKGVSIVDIKLPIKSIKATATDKDHILSWLITEFVDKLRSSGYALRTVELNRSTFNKVIAESAEFKSKYTVKFGSLEYKDSNIVTPDMANQLLGALDCPLRFKLKEEWIQISENESQNAVPDGKASLLPALDPRKLLGYMKWKTPLEMLDPIDGRTYVQFEGGRGFISSYRNSEGRFLEYGMEAIPDIEIPNKMAIADFSALM